MVKNNPPEICYANLDGWTSEIPPSACGGLTGVREEAFSDEDRNKIIYCNMPYGGVVMRCDLFDIFD